MACGRHVRWAAKSGFRFLIWGDADQLMQAIPAADLFRARIKVSDPANFDALKRTSRAISGDFERARKRNSSDQSECCRTQPLTGPYLRLRLVGRSHCAMITMYASVASRNREIGNPAAWDFAISACCRHFCSNPYCWAWSGGCVGYFFRSVMQLFTISTMTGNRFSDLRSFHAHPESL